MKISSCENMRWVSHTSFWKSKPSSKRPHGKKESFIFQTKTYDDICPRPAYRFEKKKAFSTKENQDAFITEVNNYAKENIALVTIYIREPFAEEILISEEVTPTELMSDIGGLMGLFMGCSFVSAVEIVYHILKVMAIQVVEFSNGGYKTSKIFA